MDIKSILALEETHKNTINLILSGSFVKVYNRSFYLLTEQLGKPLKASARYIKSANNRLVVCGGFPAFRIATCYPQAISTLWGYQIKVSYDPKGYSDWLLRQESAAQADDLGATAIAGSRAHLCAGEAATKNPQSTDQKKDQLTLPLTKQQAEYLLHWQKNQYPIEVDFGFIESLKTKLLINTTK